MTRYITGLSRLTRIVCESKESRLQRFRVVSGMTQAAATASSQTELDVWSGRNTGLTQSTRLPLGRGDGNREGIKPEANTVFSLGSRA